MKFQVFLNANTNLVLISEINMLVFTYYHENPKFIKGILCLSQNMSR